MIEVPDLNDGIAPELIFKYLGHDTISGGMHFQCPGCKEISVVNPQSVLDGNIRIVEVIPATHYKTKNYWQALFLLLVIYLKYVTDREEAFDGFRRKLLAYGTSSHDL
jgi:hypothetical protein